MDVITLLEWLLERDVNAFLRVDAERGGTRPWTFHAVGGEDEEKWWVRVDARSAVECLQKAREALKARGLNPPESQSHGTADAFGEGSPAPG
ncbi:hypothetical protein [Microbispora rosea]|uniref:hypothetical protein n=1 Tax=Microbispora rosea TaxID=58117 RepID=UPI00117D3B4F|nr:hypothetical protein [Microbispora rosea]GIH45459.1 hypothetical protein Mro03_06380 [Microbispora rosea subsp. rosea]